MPFLALIYTLLLLLATADSIRGHLQGREPLWYFVLDVMADLGRIVLFVGYWVEGLLNGGPYLAPGLFLFSWAWGLGWAPHDVAVAVRRSKTEAERAVHERFGYSLSMALSIPAFWFGAKTALRQLHVGIS